MFQGRHEQNCGAFCGRDLFCCAAILLLLLTCGCGNMGGDDPRAVALVQQHLTPAQKRIVTDKTGERHIVMLGLHGKDAEILLPHLSGLPQLSELGVAIHDINPEQLKTIAALDSLESLSIRCEDEDLKYLQPLTNLRRLNLSGPITDAGLKYLAPLQNLRKLDLGLTEVKGPGFAELGPLPKLEWLDLHATPLDDRAIPSIVANFKMLKRLNISGTNITPAGLMQLADLHWLSNIAPPEDIIRPGENWRDQGVERMALMLEFHKAHTASKQKARAAGIEVPSVHRGPFSNAADLLEALRLKEERRQNESDAAVEQNDSEAK